MEQFAVLAFFLHFLATANIQVNGTAKRKERTVNIQQLKRKTVRKTLPTLL